MSKSKDQPRSLGQKLVNNTGWMMVQNIYSILLSLVIGSLSARYLGPSNYGLLNYGASMISFFLILSKLGFDSIVVAEMVKTPEKEASYLGTALVLRIVVSLLSFAFISLFVHLFEPEDVLLQKVTELQALSIIFESYQVFYYWFQKEYKMKYVTIAYMAAITCTGIWRISLLAGRQSVEWFALSTTVTALVGGGIVCLFFIRQYGSKLRFHWKDAKYLLSNSYHFIISGIAVTLYTQMDRIMLGKVVNSEAVGFYSAAMTIAVMWEFVPNAMINSARPAIIGVYKEDHDKFIRYFQILNLLVIGMAVVVGVGFTLLGKYAVWILYGATYEPSVRVLQWLIWATGFSMIGTARGIWIVGEGLNKYSKYYVFVGALINLILNYIFIRLWSINGAALATLISQMFVAFVGPLLFKETKQYDRIVLGSFKQIPTAKEMIREFLAERKAK